MSVPANIEQAGSSLPQLVDHAAAALTNARTAAEVLEARELASLCRTEAVGLSVEGGNQQRRSISAGFIGPGVGTPRAWVAFGRVRVRIIGPLRSRR